MFLPRTTRELSVRRPRNINRGSSRRGTRETAAREQADKHRAHQGSSAFVFLPCPPWGWRSNESPIRHRPDAPPAPSSGIGSVCVRVGKARRAKVVDGRRDGRGCGALKPEPENCARRHAAAVRPVHQPRATDAWAPGQRASFTPISCCACRMWRGGALPWQWHYGRALPSYQSVAAWGIGHTDTRLPTRTLGSSQEQITSAYYRHPSRDQTSKTFSEMKWHDTHLSPNKSSVRHGFYYSVREEWF
jgi:hypothetical protein